MSVIWHPQDTAEAIRLRTAFGAEGMYISGGTWLAAQWENGAVRPEHLIDVSGIPAMKGIAIQEDAVTIGAMTSLATIRKDPLLRRATPLLREAARNIAAPSIRNLGTIGGNVACRTGDMLPALLANEAMLVWHDGHKQSEEPVLEWLDGVRAGTVDPGRLLLQIKIRCAADETDAGDGTAVGRVVEGYHKIGRREAFTPSVVTAAYRAELTGDDVIQRIILAAGGGQMIPQRLANAERLLVGQTMQPQLMERLYEQLLREVQPSGDAFVSSEYRKQTTAAVMSAGLWQTWREAVSA